MNQKQIGIVIMIIGLLLGAFTYLAKIREDKNIDLLIQAQGGSCFLADGTCLHEDRDYTFYFLGGFLSVAALAFGVYLFAFSRTEEILEKRQKEFSKEIMESKKAKEFDAFLEGFSDDERKVIETIHAQEGIMQSTLRYKTGMSKTGLSLLLKSLEDRNIITRTLDGKSNKVYLKKKF